MKTIDLKDGYRYIPENNWLVNQETIDKFGEFIRENKIQTNRLDVNEAFLRREVRDTTQLILEVTEECNLKCSYCVYSNNYQYEKKLSGKHLHFETVKKGFEYLYEIIKDRLEKRLTISFYGGEPFVQFELVKKIVSYAKSLFKGWQLVFGATSNATLLREDIIKFLIAEDFNLLVSLDGPQYNHDAKRIYKNGKGTFRKVWKALELIKKWDANYFNTKISFNIVHSYDLPLFDIYQFYTENEIINMNRVTYNQVVTRKTDYYDKIDYDVEKIRNDFKLIFDRIQEKHINSYELTPIEEKFFRDYFVNKALNSRPKHDFVGTCFFNSRLFLDIEGKFHICESMNNRFPIGDVWQGFDFDRMVEISKQYGDIRKKYCTDCEIRYLCKPCYVVFAADGSLEMDTEYCSSAKRTVVMKLKRQIHFEEEKRKSNKKELSKLFRFHQFIAVQKGPVNSAIADFTSGDIYQVPTAIIEHFENEEYEKIPEFIKDANEAGLIIYVNSNTWVPYHNIPKKELKYFDDIGKNEIVLCIEEGVDLSVVKEQVTGFKINQIYFYGSNSGFGSPSIDDLFPGVEILYESPDYKKCSSLSVIKKSDLVKTEREFYNFSQICNNCWGHKISITKDGKIRPCIYSKIVVGDLEHLTDPKTVKKIKSYWYISKDKVETCQECELRYFCIDCREKAQRENNGELQASNPSCVYNPKTGVWKDDE
jgi:uncharacterized protein